jgi:hypothetical protein
MLVVLVMNTLEQLVKDGLLDPDFLNNLDDKEVKEDRVDREVKEVKEDRVDKYYENVAYHWLFAGNNYGWWHFHESDNDRLETAYVAGGSNCVLHINGQSYNIDYTKMLQDSGRSKRSILRVNSLDNIVLRGIAK